MMVDAGDGPKQRKFIGGLGILASLVFLAVSAVMNYRFGYTLGRSPEDGVIYGAASAAADCFKALCPFFFFAGWRARQYSVMLASAAVWFVVLGYALAGAAGHAGSNRLETAGNRQLAATTYTDLRKDLDKSEKELSWVPPHRSAETVKAALESHKAKQLQLWHYSAECTEPNGKNQREFCAEFHKLNAEIASAKSAVKHNADIAEIKRKLEKSGGGALTGESDPQAGTISRLLAIIGVVATVNKVQDWLTVLVVLLIEVGSSFGLYISVGYFRSATESAVTILAPAAAMAPSAPIQTPPAVDALLIEHQPAPVPAEDPPSTAVLDPVPARSIIPGAEQSLVDVGFPVDGPRVGNAPKRSDKEAAIAFLAWLRAYDLVDQKSLTDPVLKQLYAEFCAADGRETAAHEDLMRGQLKDLRGVTKSKPRIRDDDHPLGFRKANRWTITPGRYPRPSPTKQQEGGTVVALRPLAGAPSDGCHVCISHGSVRCSPKFEHEHRRAA